MTGGLGEARLARLERTGLGTLPAELGLELYDQSRRLDAALLVPVHLDLGALRAQARSGMLPPLLHGLVRAPARQAEAGRSLAQRLSGVPEGDRERVVLEFVQAQVAAVLGHTSGASIDPEHAFQELGFDSLAAVELRNRLARATGLRLPTTLIFDHPTPAAAARLMLTEIGGAWSADPNVDGARSVHGDGQGTLSTLLRHAHATGSIVEALPLLTGASRFRPAFASSAELGDDHRYVVQLASGSRIPKLVCVPSFVVGSSPHQFMRFAARFEGARDVLGCALPGFRGTEPVPASWSVAIDVLAGSILNAVGDAPFILVGYSIGGVVAHSLAARLEAAAAAPAGVVLIDTPLPEGEEETNRGFSLVMTKILEREHEAVPIDDANLLAMGTYMRLLAEHRPERIAARTLLIRAGEPIDKGDDAPWPAWDVCDDQVEIAADHFALIEAAAAATADATSRWLET
jgi:thioesterase domain-containing protein